jgi:hypothetical protein
MSKLKAWGTPLGLAVLFAVIGSATMWAVVNQNRRSDNFQNEVVRTARAGASYYVICELRKRDTRNCVTRSGAQADGLSKALARAQRSWGPGKAPLGYEGVLKLGKGEPADGQYLGCYRVTQSPNYRGVTFVEQVTMDGACNHITQYGEGNVTIPMPRF